MCQSRERETRLAGGFKRRDQVRCSFDRTRRNREAKKKNPLVKMSHTSPRICELHQFYYVLQTHLLYIQKPVLQLATPPVRPSVVFFCSGSVCIPSSGRSRSITDGKCRRIIKGLGLVNALALDAIELFVLHLKRKEKKRTSRAFTDHFIILILRPAATDKEEVTLLQVRARPRQQKAENWREGPNRCKTGERVHRNNDNVVGCYDTK